MGESKSTSHKTGNPLGCVLASLVDVRKIELLLIEPREWGTPFSEE